MGSIANIHSSFKFTIDFSFKEFPEFVRILAYFYKAAVKANFLTKLHNAKAFKKIIP